MADLQRRLLQSYLLGTISPRSGLGSLHRSPSRLRLWLLVGFVGIVGSGSGWYLLKKRLMVRPPAPVALAQPALPPEIVKEPAPLTAFRMLGELGSATLHVEESFLREALQLLQEAAAGSATFKVAPELASQWDNAPEQEPKVQLHLFGGSLLTKLRLLAAQTSLVLQETKDGALLVPDTGLKRLPDAAWQRTVAPEQAERWLRQQDHLRSLAYRWHLDQAQGCLLTNSYPEALQEAAKLRWLAPDNAVSASIESRVAEQAAEAPGLPGVTPAEQLPMAVVRVFTLAELMQLHGLPISAQHWEGNAGTLTISDTLRHVRIAEAVLAALDESNQPICQVQAYHLAPESAGALAQNTATATIHTGAEGLSLRASRVELGQADSGPLLMGSTTTLATISAPQQLSLRDVQKVGRRFHFTWEFTGDPAASASDPLLGNSPLATGRLSLDAGDWLELPDPKVTGSSWILQISPSP